MNPGLTFYTLEGFSEWNRTCLQQVVAFSDLFRHFSQLCEASTVMAKTPWSLCAATGCSAAPRQRQTDRLPLLSLAILIGLVYGKNCRQSPYISREKPSFPLDFPLHQSNEIQFPWADSPEKSSGQIPRRSVKTRRVGSMDPGWGCDQFCRPNVGSQKTLNVGSILEHRDIPRWRKMMLDICCKLLQHR